MYLVVYSELQPELLQKAVSNHQSAFHGDNSPLPGKGKSHTGISLGYKVDGLNLEPNLFAS